MKTIEYDGITYQFSKQLEVGDLFHGGHLYQWRNADGDVMEQVGEEYELLHPDLAKLAMESGAIYEYVPIGGN